MKVQQMWKAMFNCQPGAEAVANLILEWMMEHGLDQTLTHLAGDSTNSNTGWKK